jgi:hypothetical protein
MAALHWEAQRKQSVVNRKHKVELERQEQLKQLMEQNERELREGKTRQGSSYERQLHKLQQGMSDRCARGEYHQSQDAQRRREFHEANKGAPTGKIPMRYNDTIYAQQW